RTRHADLFRVPKPLRGPMSAAGRQGRRTAPEYDSKRADSLRGSTWLVSLSLLAVSGFLSARSNGPRRAFAQPPPPPRRSNIVEVTPRQIALVCRLQSDRF